MFADRLRIALESGLVLLPATGRIAVLEPAADADLSALPSDRTEVVTRHFTRHTAFRSQGYATAREATGPYDLAFVCLPRAKDRARDLIAAARAATSGALVIDGQKTDGAESILKAVRKETATGDALAKSHGKLFTVLGGDFPHWRAAPATAPNGFRTAPGVFSADGIDPGSAALIAALPERLPGPVVDLGAGWGVLAAAALARGAASVDLVEDDHAALDAARANISDPRARFHWADALTWQSAAPAAHVLMNPPFHTGRAADPRLGQDFIRAAALLLARSGTLWLVANRHLPYETVLHEAFQTVETLDQTAQYKLTRARLPRSPRKG